jgi:hypothetical protein
VCRSDPKDSDKTHSDSACAVAVVLAVYGLRAPTMLRRDQLGPDDDDGGSGGGVREPSGPKGPIPISSATGA